MRGGDGMVEIQTAAKEKVTEILKDYDGVYIDYSAPDDEYTNNLGKLSKPEEK